MPVKGGYLIIAGLGGVVFWSGLRGKSWSGVLQSLVRGKSPKDVPSINTIQPGSTSGGGGFGGGGFSGSGSQSDIANLAEQLKNSYSYVFGGAPKNGVVDCSSYVNEIVGDRLGLPIPLYAAGKYHGQTHGPPTTVWFGWRGAVTVPRSQAMPGDIVVWLTHMGVVIDNGHNMVSALNPHDGIKQSPIDGIIVGEPMRIRRLRVV